MTTQKLKTRCHFVNSKILNRLYGLLRIAPPGSFQEYVGTATTGIGVELSTEELLEVEPKLQDWWRVVCFYSLRLRLATVIETAVLLDRLLHLREEGCPSTLAAIFDP